MSRTRFVICGALAALTVVVATSDEVRADEVRVGADDHRDGGGPADSVPSEGYIGIRTARLSAADRTGARGLPEGAGVPITYVVAGSPAEHAGLDSNDILIAVDGQFVGADDDLETIVRRLAPGDRVELHFLREGRRRRTFVEVERRRPPVVVDANDHAELARAALLTQQRPKSRRNDLGLASGPVRERAVALSTKGAGPVRVEVEESGRTWTWGADDDVPNDVPARAVEDVERLLVGFERQRARNGLRLRVQPHADGEKRSVVVLICQPDSKGGYHLIEVERPTTADGAVPVDDVLGEKRLRGELERLSDPVREKLVKALRTHQPPPVQVQVRGPQ